MKRLLTLTILVLTLSVQAQMVQTDRRWTVAEEYPENTFRAVRSLTTRSMVYGFMGSETHGGNTYQMLYQSPDSLLSMAVVRAASVRQEGDTVYAWISGQDVLLYDFSLEVGDTTYYRLNLFENLTMVVDSVDTISVSGEDKRRIIFEEIDQYGHYLNEVWIEDVGSIHGPLFPIAPRLFNDGYYTHSYQYLTCLYRLSGPWWRQQTDNVWMHDSVDRCFVSHVTGVVEYDQSVGVYYDRPNMQVYIHTPGDVDTLHVAMWNYFDIGTMTDVTSALNVEVYPEGFVIIDFDADEITDRMVPVGIPLLTTVTDNSLMGLDCRPLPVYWLPPEHGLADDYGPDIPDFELPDIEAGPGKTYTVDVSGWSPGHYRMEIYFDCRYINTFLFINY